MTTIAVVLDVSLTMAEEARLQQTSCSARKEQKMRLAEQARAEEVK
jgi:hypothetical protein